MHQGINNNPVSLLKTCCTLDGEPLSLLLLLSLSDKLLTVIVYVDDFGQQTLSTNSHFPPPSRPRSRLLQSPRSGSCPQPGFWPRSGTTGLQPGFRSGSRPQPGFWPRSGCCPQPCHCRQGILIAAEESRQGILIAAEESCQGILIAAVASLLSPAWPLGQMLHMISRC